MTGPDCVIVAGDFTPWGGMDKANYEFARYVTGTLGKRLTIVAHRVAAPLDTNPLVSWHRVPRPLGMHALGAPILARAGRRFRNRGVLISNGGNCRDAALTWVHAVHAAWEPDVDAAPPTVRVRARLQKARARRAEAAAVRAARLVVTNSNRARMQLIERLGVSESSVVTVYYGNDASLFRPVASAERSAARRSLGWDEHRRTAIFIGALGHDRSKGFDVLLEAWKRLSREAEWDVDLVAIGDGAAVPHWRREAETLGSRVRIEGFRTDIPMVLRAADLLISPTRYDAYGLAVHEAMCCGIPAFVTRCAGVAERYPSNLRELLLDDPPSVDDLAARLVAWRSDVSAIRERVRTFGTELHRRTWADMSRELAALVDRVATEIAR